MKKILLATAAILMLSSCDDDAGVASQNLSKDADNFKIARRVVFYNGFTNDYMLEIRGLCSLQPTTTTKGIAVVCKVGDNEFKKHILGLSDNVTYFVEQLDPKNVSTNFYKVIFKPSLIIPDVEIR